MHSFSRARTIRLRICLRRHMIRSRVSRIQRIELTRLDFSSSGFVGALNEVLDSQVESGNRWELQLWTAFGKLKGIKSTSWAIRMVEGAAKELKRFSISLINISKIYCFCFQARRYTNQIKTKHELQWHRHRPCGIYFLLNILEMFFYFYLWNCMRFLLFLKNYSKHKWIYSLHKIITIDKTRKNTFSSVKCLA